MLGLTPTTPAPPSSEANIFDVNALDFEARVIHASMEKPVILDFWAPWCGPCKQLMPVLEKIVKAAGGDILLAKVNIDDNPELAQALQVQSVPTVFGFLGGRPVDAFQGVVPESQIQAFIDKLIQASKAAQPGAIDIDEALKSAASALAENDLQTAQSLYGQILQQDEKNVSAYVGMVRTFIAANMVQQAAAMVESLPDEIKDSPKFTEAKTALELAQNPPDTSALGALEQKVAKNPKDMEAKCALASVQFGAGQKEQAIDTLLEAIETDREWNEQEARKILLTFFEALGHSDPLTIQGRKKLSGILFS